MTGKEGEGCAGEGAAVLSSRVTESRRHETGGRQRRSSEEPPEATKMLIAHLICSFTGHNLQISLKINAIKRAG